MIALAEVGLDENTIIMKISDHVDWLGYHGLILKWSMHYDGLLKVPMIVKGPGLPVGKRIEDPVSTLDLTATCCDYAQTDAQLPQNGSSLRKLTETDEDSREFAMNEWELLPTRAGVALSLRTVRTNRITWFTIINPKRARCMILKTTRMNLTTSSTSQILQIFRMLCLPCWNSDPKISNPMEPKSDWRKVITCRYCGRLSLLILPPSTR